MYLHQILHDYPSSGIILRVHVCVCTLRCLYRQQVIEAIRYATIFFGKNEKITWRIESSNQSRLWQKSSNCSKHSVDRSDQICQSLRTHLPFNDILIAVSSFEVVNRQNHRQNLINVLAIYVTLEKKLQHRIFLSLFY